MTNAIHSTGRSAPLRLVLGALLAIGPATVGHAQDQAGRGAYLANITGCVGCHSPHDAAGHILDNRLLAGGDHPIHVAGGGALYPPNITPDPAAGIGGWSVPEIAAALREGWTPDGRRLSAAMPWRTQYAALTDADALAIAKYVHSVVPVPSPPAAMPKGG